MLEAAAGSGTDCPCAWPSSPQSCAGEINLLAAGKMDGGGKDCRQGQQEKRIRRAQLGGDEGFSWRVGIRDGRKVLIKLGGMEGGREGEGSARELSPIASSARQRGPLPCALRFTQTTKFYKVLRLGGVCPPFPSLPPHPPTHTHTSGAYNQRGDQSGYYLVATCNSTESKQQHGFLVARQSQRQVQGVPIFHASGCDFPLTPLFSRRVTWEVCKPIASPPLNLYPQRHLLARDPVARGDV